MERAERAWRTVEVTRRFLSKFFQEYQGYYRNQGRLLEKKEQSLRDAGDEISEALSDDKQIASELLGEAVQFQDRLFRLIDDVRAHLRSAMNKGTEARSENNLSKRMLLELEMRDQLILASASMGVLAAELDAEFRPVVQGDARPRVLSFSEIKAGDLPSVLQKMQTVFDEKEAVRKRAEHLSARLTTNPDVAADDADPYLRQIGVGTSDGRWKNDLFLQHAKAGGNASYVIVRETPTRYTVHRVRSDPSVLIKSQLRLARTGLQVVSSIAGVPSLGAGGAMKPSGDGATQSVKRQIGEAQARTKRLRALRAQLTNHLRDFETHATSLRSQLDDADREQREAEIALASLITGTEYEKQRQLLEAAEARLTEAMSERDTVHVARERLEAIVDDAAQRLSEANERAAELARQIRALEKDIDRNKSELSTLEEATSAADEEHQRRSDELREIRSQLGEKTDEEARQQPVIDNLSTELEEVRAELEGISDDDEDGAISDLEARIAELEGDLRAAEAKKAELTQEIEGLRQSLEQVESALADAEQLASEKAEQAKESAAALAEKEARLAAAQQLAEMNEAEVLRQRQRLDAAGPDLERTSATEQAMSAVVDQLEQTVTAVKRSLRQEKTRQIREVVERAQLASAKASSIRALVDEKSARYARERVAPVLTNFGRSLHRLGAGQ